MKLKFDVSDSFQADPFIFEDGGRLYLYVTGLKGVEAYSAEDVFGVWKYEGVVTRFKRGEDFWAPAVIKYAGMYYMYVSCNVGENFQFLHAARSASPLGPFEDEKCLYDHFSIDAHVVETADGLFLWFAQNNTECNRIGTRVYVDRLLDPYTPENCPREVIVPSFDEEIFERSRFEEGEDWHTIEGPFWFREGDWQYVMYSGGCFENDTYHVGYAAAKSDEEDLKKVEFIKAENGGAFSPVLIKNEFEEGTGHHSVIKYRGEYYAIYHGRDYCERESDEYVEARTARICRLTVRDGRITAQRYEDRI